MNRKLAVECFNGTWHLLLKERRTPEQDLEMIHMAHASRYHWGVVGTPANLAIGEWQLSRVYAVLRRPEPALYHAAQALRLCRDEGLRDFYLAFAYEALARASSVAGKPRDMRRFLALGRKAAEDIVEQEDRDLFYRDLESIR